MSNLAPPPEDLVPSDDDDWLPPIPDALDLVVETDAMVAMFVAERYLRVESMRQDALADARRHGYQLTEVLERGVRLELAAALGVTERAAGLLVAEADALVNRYPATLNSLSGARITQRHATLLVEAMDAVEPAFRDQLLHPAIELAENNPVGTFRRKLRTLVDTVRAQTLTERYEHAIHKRRVWVETGDDGIALLQWYGPAVDIRAAHARLTAQAKALANAPEESRTLDQLRSDVLGDLLITGDTALLPPDARGIRATVFVTVPALALLDGDTARHGIASVEGVGPVPIDVARELCGGAKSWMRVLTHPETGIVLSLGRKKYRPTPDLKRAARWRSDTCAGPGCSMPASRCDIDHNVAWADGGDTAIWNHAPLCEGHHTVRHHTQWRIEQVPDSGGVIRWTSPSGRVYLVEPERRTPTFRPTAAAADGDPPPF
jgi:hypothetical protein